MAEAQKEYPIILDDGQMCFYNQKRFICGDWSWTNFAHQCNYEYRTGETCGIRLVNVTESAPTVCRLCQNIDTKRRNRQKELDRINRWKREGGTLTASIAKSEKLVLGFEAEIRELVRELDGKRRMV
ncbi:hypothetical protein BDV12DRAFT_200027 [Aspergillus spectabilis]